MCVCVCTGQVAIAGTAFLRGRVWIQRAANNGGSVFPFVTSDELPPSSPCLHTPSPPPPPLPFHSVLARHPVPSHRDALPADHQGVEGFLTTAKSGGWSGHAEGGNDIRVMDACLSGGKTFYFFF